MPATLRDNVLVERSLPQTDSILLGRAQLLEESDLMLLKAVIIYKQNAELVSQLTGLQAYRVRRRVRQLVRLITSKAFVAAMRAMPHMSPGDAQIAKLHYCQGLNLAQIGQQLGMNRYQLRRRLDCVRGLIATISQTRHISVPDARGQGRSILKLYPKGVFQCPSVKIARRGRIA